MQADVAPRGAGKNGIRVVVLVERFKDDDFIPGLIVASREAIMPSVEPQQTVISASGSKVIPVSVASRAAMALRRFFDPQVMLY